MDAIRTTSSVRQARQRTQTSRVSTDALNNRYNDEGILALVPSARWEEAYKGCLRLRCDQRVQVDADIAQASSLFNIMRHHDRGTLRLPVQ